jgi:glycine/D-amino acid oxidase-like deaminating enzyme
MGYESPWIAQLNRNRAVTPLDRDRETDIAIVGGGIAGVATAYHVLRDTGRSVILLEADQIARGATGHNAGQVVSAFERPLSEIAAEFGFEPAVAAQRALLGAWDLLDDICRTAALRVPLWRFTGHIGFTQMPQLRQHCEMLALFERGGLPFEPVLVAEESTVIEQLPEECRKYCLTVPHDRVLEMLETRQTHYIAAGGAKVGCMNSAFFCEELIGYLLATYAERFLLAERSPVRDCVVDPAERRIFALTEHHTITAQHVVFCTNGYRTCPIRDAGGNLLWDPEEDIRGIVGYMAGYHESPLRDPAAVRYHPLELKHHTDPYFYLTRRPYTIGPDDLSLVAVGGPEVFLLPGTLYKPQQSYDPEAPGEIDEFIASTYRQSPGGILEPGFVWHGQMGYTPGEIRWIGPDPEIPGIIYNLGCNGIGILPSIYGGKRVAEFLSKGTLEPSIFDPRMAGRSKGV